MNAVAVGRLHFPTRYTGTSFVLTIDFLETAEQYVALEVPNDLIWARHLPAARETLAAVGVTDVPLIGVAKGPDRDAGNETFYLTDKPAVKLPPRDPLLYFIQRMRDEAHRFAIGSHRTRRKKDIREAGLQEIPGIGPTRKRALLHHFGTLKAIERASLADLSQVPGINEETARKIHDFFHEKAT